MNYFDKFREMEKTEDLTIEPQVNILWADPYGHILNFYQLLKKRGIEGYEHEEPVTQMGPVRVFYCGRNANLIPDEAFDICWVSRCHEQGGGRNIANAVKDELFPFKNHAEYTIYSDCCHGEGAREASRQGTSHAVSDSISYRLMAEMCLDLIQLNTTYIECGLDFARAAQLATDPRKVKLYTEFEEKKLK